LTKRVDVRVVRKQDCDRVGQGCVLEMDAHHFFSLVRSVFFLGTRIVFSNVFCLVRETVLVTSFRTNAKDKMTHSTRKMTHSTRKINGRTRLQWIELLLHHTPGTVDRMSLSSIARPDLIALQYGLKNPRCSKRLTKPRKQ
jgi:hypothetical protein